MNFDRLPTYFLQACFSSFFLFLFTAPISSAQSDSINLNKYWHYRHRLTNEFMLVGEGQGMSEPAQKRSNEATLEWSDATIDLGWYIAVLGTEYGLLSKNHQNTDSTKKELYCALTAFNRLDDYAESYFHEVINCGSKPEPCTGFTARNGFFVRDDVTDSFVLANNLHFKLSNINKEDPADPGFERGILEGYGPREMSFDQVVHLMMGFAMVTRYVDTAAVYNGMNLNLETKAIVSRIIHQVRHGVWKIKNPVTHQSVMGVTFSKKPFGIHPIKSDAAGALADFMTYGFAVAASKIEDGYVRGHFLKKSFRNFSTSLNKPFFKRSRCINNNILSLIVVAIGDSWGKNTQKRLYEKATKLHHEQIPLIHLALYGPIQKKKKNQIPTTFFESISTMLNTAPWEGTGTNASDLNWTGNNRFRDLPRHTPIYKNLFYNGLDYMLIYNLYRLASNENLDYKMVYF